VFDPGNEVCGAATVMKSSAPTAKSIAPSSKLILTLEEAPSVSVSIDVFAQLDIRVGRIIEVDDIPQARKPLYRFKIDFGPMGIKQCAGGIKPYYTKEQLLGKQVVAVVNLEPKSVVGVVSECMMLASFTETDLSLLMPDKEMPLGTKVA
jgi:tRNA-binding protein